MRLAIS